MKDPAMLKPRTLHLPPAGRPQWVCPPDDQLDLLYLGWGKRRFGVNPIPQSRHPGWVYFLIQSGTPTLRLDTKALPTKADQLLIVGPDCASGWGDKAGGVSKLLTWVWRTPPRCVACEIPKDDLLVFPVGAPLRRALEHAHTLCRDEVRHPSGLTKPALEQARLHADLAIARAMQSRPAAPDSALRLELALRWLEENLTAQKPVTALSEYLQVSPVTLNRLFHSHLNESVAAHHGRLRMERAGQLLTLPRMAVKEVAYTLGYRHANDFSRAFKNFTGRSPGVRRN